MNQAMAVMINDSGLGFAALPQTAQTPKWQSILTSIGAAIPTVIGTYQATRQPQQPQYSQQPAPPAAPQRSQVDDGEDDSRSSTAIKTNVGFDLSKGLNIGGTNIPILYLALGAGALYLLYREPPKRGR